MAPSTPLTSAEARAHDPGLWYKDCVRPSDKAKMVTVAGYRGAPRLAVARFSSAYRNGRRFLLVHGNPGEMDDYGPLIEDLRHIGEVVLVDLPGFGASPALQGGASAMGLRPLSRLLDELLEQLGLSDCIVVGHSHGAAIAQTMAVHHPRRVAGLVLLGSLGYPAHLTYRILPTPGLETALRLVARGVKLPFAGRLLRRALAIAMRPIYAPRAVTRAHVDEELARFLRHPGMLRSMAQLTKGRPSEALIRGAAKIRCRVLFVHGEKDSLVPIHRAKSLHHAMLGARGDSRFIALARAGHMLPLFDAASVNRVLTTWLDDEAPLSTINA